MCHHCMGVTACCLIVTRMGFPVGKSVLLLAFEVHEVVEKECQVSCSSGVAGNEEDSGEETENDDKLQSWCKPTKDLDRNHNAFSLHL